MGGFGLTELLVVLAIVVLIFGPKRLKTLGSDLGSAIKGFRKAVSDDEKANAAATEESKVIEGEVTSSNVSSDSQSKQKSNV